MSAYNRFPRARYRTATERTLALLDRSGDCLTEHGELLHLEDWDALVNAAMSESLLVLSGPLLRQPWFPHAVLDRDCEVLLHQRGIGALRVRRGRHTRWIVPASAWLPVDRDRPLAGEYGGAQLRTIRAVVDLAGVGVTPTPGGLGTALLRRDFPRDCPPLYRPPWWAWRTIHSTITGGRADLAAAVRKLPVAWEADANGAYLAASRTVPGGTTYPCLGAPPPAAVTSYCYYDVRVPGPSLILGPLHCRNPTTRHLDYPTSGHWSGWYWQEEIAAARAAGMVCQAQGGYWWRSWHDGFRLWAESLHTLRNTAGNAAAGKLLKHAGVAALGRCGRDRNVYRLVADPAPGDILYCDPALGLTATYGLRTETPDPEQEGLLAHVASFIHAAVRVQLYHAALPYALDGSLLSSNFDALYTRDRPDLVESTELGGWKVRALHNVSIPQPRWIYSDEKIRTPGRAA